MSILITGGAGFLGSHLVHACIAKNERVIVLDNLSTGRLKNLSSLASHESFQLVHGDIRDASLVDRLICKVDLVYHFAAGVGVRNIIEKPVETLAVNCEGSRQIFSTCAKLGKKMVFASTSEVYGKSQKLTLAETDDIVLGQTAVGRWGYACSKALDEFLAYAYAKESQLRFVIIRYFNVVGPRQSPDFGMVLPTFITQAKQGKPLTIFGTGEQSRCFLHVYDAVEATLALTSHANAEGGIFNIGNPEPITINDLAEKVIQITKSGSSIVRVNPGEFYDRDFADMQTRVPDISKAIKEIQFQPKRSIDDAIRDYLAECEEQLKLG